MTTRIRIDHHGEKQLEIEHDTPLPCPFCGCTEIYVGHAQAFAFHVQCQNATCRASSGNVYYPEECEPEPPIEIPLIREAVRRWNERAHKQIITDALGVVAKMAEFFRRLETEALEILVSDQLLEEYDAVFASSKEIIERARRVKLCE